MLTGADEKIITNQDGQARPNKKPRPMLETLVGANYYRLSPEAA
jgi:hypothetical protein